MQMRKSSQPNINILIPVQYAYGLAFRGVMAGSVIGINLQRRWPEAGRYIAIIAIAVIITPYIRMVCTILTIKFRRRKQ